MSRHKYISSFAIENLDEFKNRLYALADTFDVCAVYDSCLSGSACGYKKYEMIAGLGELARMESGPDHFKSFHAFHKNNKDWIFGGISYDLKNELENLRSENIDPVEFPPAWFFIPEHVITVSADGRLATIHSAKNENGLINQLNGKSKLQSSGKWTSSPVLQSNVTEEQYLANIEAIREHIRSGDVYELNYCMQFAGEYTLGDHALDLHRRLIDISPVPFAAYARFDKFEVLSASPERYLLKDQQSIISQPIKGTASRSADKPTDQQNRLRLQNSLKDRAENVMIVDLVRNDLARTCKPGSIQVEELFGIYPFPQVFQMISTIKGELREDMNFSDAIRMSFPMGSMTGAPKIAAMELIDHFEDFKRGWYSGSIGYIDPEGNFDLNVLIRSIFINKSNLKMAYAVGGAITIDSDPRDEYMECMWKASAIRSLFDQIRQSNH